MRGRLVGLREIARITVGFWDRRHKPHSVQELATDRRFGSLLCHSRSAPIGLAQALDKPCVPERHSECGQESTIESCDGHG